MIYLNYSGTLLGRAAGNTIQDCLPLGINLNPEPPEHEAGVLSILQG
jgi:hypothetical protein